MSAGPGIYALIRPGYELKYGQCVIKIGSSIHVGTRINSGDYRTMFACDDMPPFLWSIHPIGYESIAEIQHIEKIIHHNIKSYRVDPKRELFYNVDINLVKQILDYLGIEYVVNFEKLKPKMTEMQLMYKETNHILEEIELNNKDIKVLDKVGLDVSNVETKPVIKNNSVNIDLNSIGVKSAKDNTIKIDLSSIYIKPVKDNTVKIDLSSINMKPIEDKTVKVDLNIPNMKPAIEENIKPLSYQVDIINKIIDYYKSGNSIGKIIIACGYGKTYIILFVIKELMKIGLINNFTIYVPTIILSEQFAKIAGNILSINIYEYNSDNNKDKIINSINGKYGIISTYDSAKDLYDNMNKKNIISDFNIYDESHNTCVISKTLDEYSPYRDTITFKSKFKVFLTATEKCVSSKINKVRVKVEYDEDDEMDEEIEMGDDIEEKYYEEEIEEISNIISMDDEKFYGKTIININFEEAIEDGIISDYQYAMVNNNEPVSVLKKAIPELNLQHTLTYHNTIKEAKELCDNLNLNGIKAFYMDGSMNSKERNNILKDFEENKNSVLCSCRVLSEGVSLNYVDSIYFVSPKSSTIDIIQSLSRALRLHKDKNMATIIIENNIEKYADIIKNMVIVDPRLKTNYRKMIINLGFSKESINKNIEEIKYTIIGRTEIIWNYNYQICTEYEHIYNKSIVKRLNYKGINIGHWISNQKQRYTGQNNKTLLSIEQKNKLMLLITWINWLNKCNDKDKKWELKYLLCIEHEKEHNSLIVWDTYYKHNNIGRWLCTQRERFNSNNILLDITKKNKLTVLKSWGKLLNTETDIYKIWNYKYELCVEYEKENNILIKSNIKYKNSNISTWIYHQIRRYKNITTDGSTPLNETQKTKLLLLNTAINLLNRNDNQWEYKYQLCVEYEKTTNKIKQGLLYKDENIGSWFHHQRSNYLGSEINMGSKPLTSLQISKLFLLNTWIEIENKKNVWEKKYQLCLEYQKIINPTITISSTHKGVNLGNWIKAQKRKRKAKTLTDEQQNKLLLINAWREWIIKNPI
jgi:superfamily II DNA or RNA helicase